MKQPEIMMDFAAYKRAPPAAMGADLFGGNDNAHQTLRYDF